MDSVVAFFKNRVLTALVLGGYTEPEPGIEPTNECYSGIDSYIYQNQIRLRKSDVQLIMSTINTRNQIISAVNSTPFFSGYKTYDSLKQAVSDLETVCPEDPNALLFNVKLNPEFAALSGLVAAKSADALELDETAAAAHCPVNRILLNESDNLGWDMLKGWTMDEDRQTPERLLKAFVRTHLYRPLFFDATDFNTFTTDPRAYRCKTEKSFVKHDGTEHQLVLDRDTLEVLQDESGLGHNDGDDYNITNIAYRTNTNMLDYTIEYDPIQIVDNKFVHRDIEYYVVENDQRHVTAIYFNKFQKEMQSSSNWIALNEHGKFSIKGTTYQIQDDGACLQVFVVLDNFRSQFIQELDDGKFTIEGRHYVVEDGYVKCTGVDDNLLVKIPINASGVGVYREWNLTFRVLQDANQIQVVGRHSADIKDKVVEEWCEFDDAKDIDNPALPIRIAENKTYDWYLANEMQRLIQAYPSIRGPLSRLGNGVLFSGGMLETQCKVKLVHEVQDGYVVSKCVLTKKIGDGEETTQQLGVLYDKDMNETPGKIVKGTMTNNGILDGNSNVKDTVFIVKDLAGGRNNCNMVWMDSATWNATVKLRENVGTMSKVESGNTYKLVADFGLKPGYPSMLELVPSFASQEDMSEDPQGYVVQTKYDGTGKYSVKPNDNLVNVVADGYRYIVHLDTLRIDRFEFRETSVSTMDFTTQYQYVQLRNNLLQNIKQYMMSQIVQDILDNGIKTNISFKPRGFS